MTTVLLVNPAAGRGRGARVAAEALRAARRAWPDVEAWRTAGPGDGVRLAAEAAAAGVRRVVVVGGDGSVHEAANGLLSAGLPELPPLGVVPVGTGNDFARAVGTSRLRPGAAIAALAAGRVARFDAGRAGNEWFVNSMGIGFDADTARRANRLRRLKGFAAYLVAVAQTLADIRMLRITAAWDGGRHDGEALLIELGNNGSTGGGFRLVPDARCDDGQLDLCLITSRGLRGALAKLPFVLVARHAGLRDVTLARTTFLDLQAHADELVVHLDGEIRAYRPAVLRVDVVPACLPVIVASRP
jgi:YegS/Rv2252/BmrU family lipid kinase